MRCVLRCVKNTTQHICRTQSIACHQDHAIARFDTHQRTQRCNHQVLHTRALQTYTKPQSNYATLHPVPITIFSLTRLFPRVGLPRNLFLIGSLTAALRFSKGWVRKDLNLVMGIGCMPHGPRSMLAYHILFHQAMPSLILYTTVSFLADYI